MRILYSENVQGNIIRDFPFMSELVMEAYIAENPTILGDEFIILDTEFSIDLKNSIFVNDTAIPSTSKIHGRIDLLGFDYSTNELVIIELKKGKINQDAIAQLFAYLESANQNLEKLIKDITSKIEPDNNPLDKTNNVYTVKGMLLGSEISTEIKDYIISENKDNLKDLKFENHRYSIPDKFYNSNYDFNLSAIEFNRYKDESNGKVFYIINDVTSERKIDKNTYSNLRELINNRSISDVTRPILEELDSILMKIDDFNIIPKYGDGAISYKGKSKVFLYMNIQKSELRIDLYLSEKVWKFYVDQFNTRRGVRSKDTGNMHQTNPNFTFWINNKFNFEDTDNTVFLEKLIIESSKFRENEI